MNITENTLVNDVLSKFPAVKDELLKMSDKFRLLDNPVGNLLLKSLTIGGLSRKSGFSVEDIISKITSVIGKDG